MARSSWLGRLRSRFAVGSAATYSRHAKARCGGPRLRVRSFEERVLLSTVTWVGPATGGDWSQASNWSSGVLPGPQDDAVLPANVAITHSGGSDMIHGLTTGGGDSLSVTGGNMAISSDSTINGNAQA